jgi:hypothetical protein
MPIVIGAVVLVIIGVGATFFLSSNKETPAVSVNNEIFLNDPALDVVDETQGSREEVSGIGALIEIRPEDVVEETEVPIAPVETDSVFINGSYSADASYFTPRRVQHDMVITLEVENDVIVDANITYDGGPAGTPNHTRFDEAYTTEVIGVSLSEVALSRTGGASLTSQAFNEAVEIIKADAAS